MITSLWPVTLCRPSFLACDQEVCPDFAFLRGVSRRPGVIGYRPVGTLWQPERPPGEPGERYRVSS